MVPGLVMAVVGMLLLTQIDQDTSYWTHVLPGDGAHERRAWPACSSRRPAPPSSASSSHDAGVASAVLNTSQQIGGSLGTALLNTLFAGAVTATSPTTRRPAPAEAEQILPLAFIHGYHVAFFWGAVLFAGALLVAIVLINAHKEDIPADAAAVAD